MLSNQGVGEEKSEKRGKERRKELVTGHNEGKTWKQAF